MSGGLYLTEYHPELRVVYDLGKRSWPTGVSTTLWPTYAIFWLIRSKAEAIRQGRISAGEAGSYWRCGSSGFYLDEPHMNVALP
ncbi:MAG: hypothetical protein MZV70_48805 [Desulfobacterales bacterium]|nr:hypothetical protein [Desulfobacterales bacterium]